MVDFTDDEDSLCGFVRSVGNTGGGDFEECYELVLSEAHEKLTWREEAQKSLVVIGDATPHKPSYPLNTRNLDWRKECATLKQKGIKIYSVQALNRSISTGFYRDMATLTDGFHLFLDQFSSIVNFMMAICYREQGLDELQVYEDEVQGRGINRELHRMFDHLAGRTTPHTVTVTVPNADGLISVNPSRFQVLRVDNKISIKDFVQRNSLIFKTGRGFYEFTKPEAVSHKKEVVLVDKVSGDMFTGTEACRLIGAGDPKKKIKPSSLYKYRVFVQSTSYNRVLVPDTGFLYEVDSEF